VGAEPEAQMIHPQGGILRLPFTRKEIIGREAGEYLPEGSIIAIGEDGKLYAWPEDIDENTKRVTL
jgi:hypothetical protein